jgi:acyl carrier protein
MLERSAYRQLEFQTEPLPKHGLKRLNELQPFKRDDHIKISEPPSPPPLVFLGRKVESSVARASESEWDSLKHMQIAFAVEDKFGVQFTEEEIPRLDSLVGFAEHLENSYAA